MVSARMTDPPQSQFHSCGARFSSKRVKPIPTSNFAGGSADRHGPPAMAMKKSTFWPNGSTIKVGFMERVGSPGVTPTPVSDFVKAMVQQKAKIWETYANITWKFVDMSESPDVRVAFEAGGSWSYMGTECRSIDPSKSTMNFGWFDDQTADDEFERVAVHEFGHTLGCCHELQSPSVGQTIIWNKPKVYAYYLQADGWDQDEVDAQVLTPDDPNEDIFSAFDATSIMCYPIPEGLANITIGWNKHLSPMDEDFISSVYPKQTNDVGTFITQDLAKKFPPNNANALEVSFNRPQKVAPDFACGLHAVNIDGKHNLRILASIDQISKEKFTAHADTWSDTRLWSAGMSWVETTDHTKRQVGLFDTKQWSTPSKPLSTVTQHVVFPSAFSATPTVLLFLAGFDLSKAHDWKLTTSVSNVSSSGFDLTVAAGGDTQCFSAQVSWVAFPSFLASICGGTIATTDGHAVGVKRSGQIKFPSGKFVKDAPPARVMVAFNSLDFKHGSDLKTRAYTDTITDTGFAWYSERVDGTSEGAAGLTWIAL